MGGYFAPFSSESDDEADGHPRNTTGARREPGGSQGRGHPPKAPTRRPGVIASGLARECILKNTKKYKVGKTTRKTVQKSHAKVAKREVR